MFLYFNLKQQLFVILNDNYFKHFSSNEINLDGYEFIDVFQVPNSRKRCLTFLITYVI